MQPLQQRPLVPWQQPGQAKGSGVLQDAKEGLAQHFSVEGCQRSVLGLFSGCSLGYRVNWQVVS